MNISDVSAIRDCTSCQLCAIVCPKEAIHIELNKEGFYRPAVNMDKCIDCNLCTKVCYKFDNSISITSKDKLAKTSLYSAWSTDDELVYNTTSGGIGDILAHELQNCGYKVVGCVYNDSKERAEHLIASDEKDLLAFRGSKYIQSYTFDAFKEVVRKCRTEKFAVFGTPCQIYALYKIASHKKTLDNFFFIDLYCHGCPSMHVWTKMQSFIKEKTNTQYFDKVIFRSKAMGWGTFCLEIKNEARKSIFKSSRNLCGFYELFFCDQILNDGCNECLLRGTHEYTDIRLGDFWGKKYLNNTRGVSAVSVVSERAKEVFDSIKKKGIWFQACEYEEFLPYQSWGTRHYPQTTIRQALLESLQDKNLTIKDTCKTLHRMQPMSRKLIRYVKNILAYFPLEFSNFIKKFL